jgi:hypothetical protein
VPNARRSLPTFIRMHLATSSIAVGERPKKGTFRPCIDNLPSSTLMGCFREHFALKESVAIGVFRPGSYRKEILTYAPFDAYLKTAKLPLTLEYLVPAAGQRNVEADVYVVSTAEAKKVFTTSPGYWFISLGALRSKGLGQSSLRYIDEVKPERRTGTLRAHLRESDARALGIDLEQDLVRPQYGYLFRPDSYRIGGHYERALFTGTILTGPDFLIGEEYSYDH